MTAMTRHRDYLLVLQSLQKHLSNDVDHHHHHHHYYHNHHTIIIILFITLTIIIIIIIIPSATSSSTSSSSSSSINQSINLSILRPTDEGMRAPSSRQVMHFSTSHPLSGVLCVDEHIQTS